MKILRWFLRIALFITALLLVIALFSIRPLNSTPYNQTAFYKEMMHRLDSLPPSRVASNSVDTPQYIHVGWAKVNITPPFPVSTAGYGNRAGKAVSAVHDSLFVRAFVLQQGGVTAAIVSCDLLIIPPEVRLQLQKDLTAIGLNWQHIFIGATHTHNSMGAWGKRYIGELFAGKYDQNVVNLISKSIVKAVENACLNFQPTTIEYQKADAHAFVVNRLVHEQGTIDPWLRFLTFTQKGGKKAALVTFAAHSTTLSDSVMQLSRDYSGILVDKLEQKEGFDEAVFMAGCVGSMAPFEPSELNDWQQAQFEAYGLEKVMSPVLTKNNALKNNTLRIETLPLSMREPQWRFAENWCFRHWLWSNLYGDYPNEVKAVRIGDVLMVGMPCDFSGELMQPLEDYAATKGKKLIVTSFNGSYVGYITKDAHYNLNKYETRIMNWFGPGNGAYFSEVIRGLIDKM